MMNIANEPYSNEMVDVWRMLLEESPSIKQQNWDLLPLIMNDLGPKDSTELYWRLLTDFPASVRRTACENFAKLHHTLDFAENMEFRSLNGSQEFKSSKTSIMLRMLRDEDTQVRHEAVHQFFGTLNGFKKDDVIKVYKEMLGSDDVFTRNMAASHFSHVAEKVDDVTPLIETMYNNMFYKDNPDIRIHFAEKFSEVMDKINPEEMPYYYKRAACDRDPEVRKAARGQFLDVAKKLGDEQLHEMWKGIEESPFSGEYQKFAQKIESRLPKVSALDKITNLFFHGIKPSHHYPGYAP